MLKYVPLLLLLAAPAFAGDAALPPVLILPTPLVSQIAAYLAEKPYKEVAQIMGAIDACAAVQVPGRGPGDCPAVADALKARADAPKLENPHE